MAKKHKAPKAKVIYKGKLKRKPRVKRIVQTNGSVLDFVGKPGEELIGTDLPEILLEPVAHSSNVDAIGYNATDAKLLVRFKGKDTVYTYDAVPKEVFEGLEAAKSKGSYLRENIVGKYQYTKG